MNIRPHSADTHNRTSCGMSGSSATAAVLAGGGKCGSNPMRIGHLDCHVTRSRAKVRPTCLGPMGHLAPRRTSTRPTREEGHNTRSHPTPAGEATQPGTPRKRNFTQPWVQKLEHNKNTVTRSGSVAVLV